MPPSISPKSAVHGKGRWRVIHRPSALNPDGWATVAEVKVGFTAPVMLTDDQRPRPHLRFVENGKAGCSFRVEFPLGTPGKKLYALHVNVPRIDEIAGQKVLTIWLAGSRDKPALILVRHVTKTGVASIPNNIAQLARQILDNPGVTVPRPSPPSYNLVPGEITSDVKSRTKYVAVTSLDILLAQRKLLDKQRGVLANQRNMLEKKIREEIKTRPFGTSRGAFSGRNADYGYSVEILQKALNEQLDPSPRLDIDGDYGPKTEAAVRRFQKQEDLKVNGDAGPQARKALGLTDPPVGSMLMPGYQAPPQDATARSYSRPQASTSVPLLGPAVRPTVSYVPPSADNSLVTVKSIIKYAEEYVQMLEERALNRPRGFSLENALREKDISHLNEQELIRMENVIAGLISAHYMKTKVDGFIEAASDFVARWMMILDSDLDPSVRFLGPGHLVYSEEAKRKAQPYHDQINALKNRVAEATSGLPPQETIEAIKEDLTSRGIANWGKRSRKGFPDRNADYGYSVKLLQKALNKQLDPSPHLSIDGDYGPMTKAAIRRFQRQSDLKVNGNAGPPTRKALNLTDKRVSVVPPARSRAVQHQVKVEKPAADPKIEEPKISVDELLRRGWQRFNKGQNSEAEADFRAVLEEEKRNLPATNGLSFVLLNQGKVKEAKLLFEWYLKKNPKAAGPLNGLARCLKAEGDLDGAIRVWKKSARASPGPNASTAGLAWAYYEKEEYAKSIPLFEMLLKGDPDNAYNLDGLKKAKEGLAEKESVEVE